MEKIQHKECELHWIDLEIIKIKIPIVNDKPKPQQQEDDQS